LISQGLGKIFALFFLCALLSLMLFHGFARASDDLLLGADVLRILIPASAYGMTYLKDDKTGRSQFLKTFLSTAGVTYGLKLAVDKERPDGGSHSFPSGHASIAFSGASFIQKRYGWKPGIPAYMAASLAGWICIETDRHYVEDVLTGAAIGTACTYIFTKPFDKVSMAVAAGNGRYGLGFRIVW
jgi:membrane-associated phospholipid phosphatase